MKTRIISALFMVPMLIFVVLGGVPLLVITLVFAAIGMHEFYKGYKNINVNPGRNWAYALLICLYIIIYVGEFTDLNPLTYAHLLLLWMFGSICLGLLMTLIRPDHNILDGPVTSIGLLYIGFFFTHVVLINQLPRYEKLVWLVFLCAFGQDICAYFSGYLFGKHKLCPNISPKKTIEGAVGGVIGSVVLCTAFGYFVYPEILGHCIIMGFFGAFFGMAGDLIASAFKRKMGIKDFGNLIPGHGGIMDRFDSVLLVAPFIYYYIIVLVKP